MWPFNLSQTYVTEPVRSTWLEKHGWSLLGSFPNRTVVCSCGYEEPVTGYVTTMHPVFDRSRHDCPDEVGIGNAC